jgi:spore maturation protein CgeB
MQQQTTGTGERIMLAGEFWNGSAGRSFCDAFRKLDFAMIEIDINAWIFRSQRTEFRIANRILNWRYRALLNAALRDGADFAAGGYFIAIKGNYIDAETIRHLRKKGLFAINIYPDVTFEHGGISMAALREYDLIATTKPFHLDYLASQGIPNAVYVELGYSAATHRPQHDLLDCKAPEYDWDISYVGNYSPHKFAWLLPLVETFGGRRFTIIGSGWLKAAQGTPLEPYVSGYQVTGDSFSRVLGRTKINLAVHFGPVGEFGWQDSISGRSFQIPASGGFMLHIDNPEIRRLFAVPDEIDVFATPHELREKIAYYLEHDDEREAMKHAAYHRCVPAHSHDARAAQIIAAARALRI